MKILDKFFKRKYVKTSVLLQMENTECGAASLGIILEYYGVHLPLRILREITGVSRDGSNALHLINAASEFGLTHKALNIDIKDINKQLSFPAILFWNFNHFLVLEGYDEDKEIFYVNDPASGRRKIGFDEFDQSFTGVAISFGKGKDFKKSGTRVNDYKFLFQILKASKPDISFIALTTLLLVIPGIVIPAFSKIFIDDVLVQQFDSMMSLLVISMIGMLAVQAVLIFLQQISLVLLGIKFSVVSSVNFITHLLKLPINFFTQRYLGDIVDRASLNERIATTLSQNISTNIINLLSSVIYGVVMLLYDLTLGTIVILLMLVNVVILFLLKDKQNAANQVVMKEKASLLGFSMNGLRIIDTIKASGTSSTFFKKWSGYQAKMLNAQQKLSIYSYMLALAPIFLNSLTLVFVLYFGSFSILEGAMTVGTLIAFQALMHSFTAPISNLVGFATELQLLKADIRRVNDVMEYDTDRLIDIEQTEKKYNNLSGDIVLKDISFSYAKYGKPLFEDFNLSIEPGAMVAIVGSSGGGKSTLVKLLSRLYYPNSGEILVDNISLNEIDRFIFSHSVAVVNQEITLFSGSIRNNLTFWNNAIALTDIHQALEDVCLLDLIDKLPNGFDYQIEEGGKNFSGGQRQCLEIARALTINPSILILDEATSALDSVIEEVIINNIKRRGCTCIIVSHRLSAIRNSNNIIVMKGGKIAEQGTHNQLMKSGKLYQELITKQ